MTTNKEVAIGDIVCYKESLPTLICNCEVLAIVSTEKEYGFKLKVVELITGRDTEVGEEFDATAVVGNGAYAGMWRLFNKGEYI